MANDLLKFNRDYYAIWMETSPSDIENKIETYMTQIESIVDSIIEDVKEYFINECNNLDERKSNDKALLDIIEECANSFINLSERFIDMKNTDFISHIDRESIIQTAEDKYQTMYKSIITNARFKPYHVFILNELDLQNKRIHDIEVENQAVLDQIEKYTTACYLQRKIEHDHRQAFADLEKKAIYTDTGLAQLLVVYILENQLLYAPKFTDFSLNRINIIEREFKASIGFLLHRVQTAPGSYGKDIQNYKMLLSRLRDYLIANHADFFSQIFPDNKEDYNPALITRYIRAISSARIIFGGSITVPVIAKMLVYANSNDSTLDPFINFRIKNNINMAYTLEPIKEDD